jgi:integrase
MRQINRLTVTAIKAAEGGTPLQDGGGLIYDPTTKRFTLRFTSPVTRKRRDLALGPLTLKVARERADEHRIAIAAGRDPLLERERTIAAEREAIERARAGGTLRACAELYHASIASGFRNAKHRAQWLASLNNHVLGPLGDRPVGSITPNDLLEILLPLQADVPETAKRVRMRLAAVFDDACLRGAASVNPAAVIKKRLADARGKRNQARHFRSLPYADVPAFVARLRSARAAAPSRLALEFLILAAARTAEVLGARWDELEGDVWTVPPARMKAGQEHRVPLTPRMLEILEEARAFERVLIFPSLSRRAKALSNMAMLEVVRGMPLDEAKPDGDTFAKLTVVHGFRSAFSAWARERTSYRVEVIEAALAHREKDRVAAAYSSQATYWADRVALAREWEAFATGAPAGTA